MHKFQKILNAASYLLFQLFIIILSLSLFQSKDSPLRMQFHTIPPLFQKKESKNHASQFLSSKRFDQSFESTPYIKSLPVN